MRVIFHPTYDRGYYADLSAKEHKILGTEIAGLMGLLDFLSLHNGLSGRFASDGERASAYLKHVEQAAGGTMIEESFKNDALGVAKCLLQWRDRLIMAGWKPSMGGDAGTPKLQLLNRIERTWKAQMRGEADRWKELADLSKTQSLLAHGTTVECRCSKALLPRLVQDVLEACKENVNFPENDHMLSDDKEIKVLHYNDLAEAYRRVAAHADEYGDSVVVNRDNVSLNHTLFAWGRPLVGATIQDSNPMTLQLFKLALSVFSRPLNIQNILSYLQLPIGPVPANLRFALANILAKNGGFGAIDWDELDSDETKCKEKAEALKKAGVATQWELEIYQYDNKENEAEEGENGRKKYQRNKHARLLEYITDPSIKQDEIPVKMLKEYIGLFSQWSSAIAFAPGDDGDEMIKSQLATVVSYFKQLSTILEHMETISYQDLEKHVHTIYQPTSIVQARAQVGSLRVVNDVNQLVDAPKNLLWLDCCGADVYNDPFEFLSSAERRWLGEQEGVTIPCTQDMLAENRREMMACLSRVENSITLVTADYHHNQKMAEHPLVAELKMQRGDRLTIEEGPIDLPLSDSMDVKKMEPKIRYDLGEIEYGGRSESNTSIDTLINYPFDYTVHYVAQLSDPSGLEMSNINTTIGNVAHCFVEGLVDRVAALPDEERVDAMAELLNNEFDSLLDTAVTTSGLILLLKENEVVYNNMRHMLKHSIEVLIKIMKAKNLTPVGCEMKHSKPLGKKINTFNARIDMELKDSQGNAVIFDFKWSYSNYYGDKIKEGKSVQLELYRRELEAEGKKVSAVGYYLFPKCRLETSDYESLKDKDGNEIITHIKAPENADLFTKIENSVAFRLGEIRSGCIDEGEEMDIQSLDYFQKQEQQNLLEVGTEKRSGRPNTKEPDRQRKIEHVKKKSNNVFTSNNESVFASSSLDYEKNNRTLEETPTTYPLMKGRLK